MKTKNLIVLIVLLVCISSTCFCVLTPNYDRGGEYSIQSRVYKDTLPEDITNEEIALKLVHRMMNRYLIGTKGWTDWVFFYKVKDIEMGENLGWTNVVIHVVPLLPSSWQNYWSHEIDRVNWFWVRVGYFMDIEDRGTFYELRGPFSGG